MPVLFPSGAWGCGLGSIAWGHGTVVDGRLPQAGPACCLTPELLVTQIFESNRWFVGSVARANGTVKPLSTKGANSLFGNGGWWAGMYGSDMHVGTPVGETKVFQNAAPVDVARNGWIGYKPNHQTGIGLSILKPDGTSVRISETLARDVALIPNTNAAVWATSKGLGASGVTVQSVQRPTAKPRALLVNGLLWLCYQFSFPDTNGDGGRLVLHPHDSLQGYIVDEAWRRFRAFRPDAIQQGTAVLVAFSRTEGESVESLVLRSFPLSAPRVDVSKFSTTPEPPEPEPMPEPIPNHLDVVKAQREKYASLSGPERANRVVNGTAWELRDEGAGMFYKPSGQNYDDRSIDILVYKHREGDPAGKGATFDILGDAEGKATPQWSRTSPSGYGDAKNWRAPTEPGGEPEPPTPVPPDPNDIKARLEQVQASMAIDLERVNGIINDL